MIIFRSLMLLDRSTQMYQCRPCKLLRVKTFRIVDGFVSFKQVVDADTKDCNRTHLARKVLQQVESFMLAYSQMI